MLLQLGSAILPGVRFLATATGADKVDYALACGADEIVGSADSRFDLRVNATTNGSGVDVIFDCIGKAAVAANIGAIRANGRWFYYGSTSGHAEFPGLPVLSKGLQISGFVIFDLLTSPELWRSGVDAVIALLSNGRLCPKIEILPASFVVEAHDRLEKRLVLGKLVLDMSDLS